MPKGISIMSQLLGFVNYNDQKDANYDIAKTILENYYKIPDLTIYELADLCFVSASSITRFIKAIGYESYRLFREDLHNTIQIDVDYSKNVNLATEADLKPIYKRYTENVIENIQYTYEHVDYDQLHRIGEMIYQTKEMAFLGLEYANMVGLHFQNKMASLNRFVQLGVTDEKQRILVDELKEGALVFVASLEGSFFYRNTDLMEKLKQKNCHVVAITMLTAGKFMNYCDEIMLCNKTNSDTEGRITLNYIIELIIMYYYINFSKG